MSIHIGAEPGQIAPTVLLPGDPLRAKHFAETMLEDVICFNEVRNMLGFTGRYGDKRISVMGTGMGIPSHSIYVNELIRDYGATTLMRVGTCGSVQADLALGDVVLAMSASTDSQTNRLRFGGMDYAPTASFELLLAAHAAAQSRGIEVRVGSIFSSDRFYNDNPDWWKIWAAYGVLAVEMETAALYTLAAQHGVRALSILTVSDNIVKGQAATAEERETAYTRMAEIAMTIAPQERIGE
ncbi:MAG: purine-nucleoside phosphorylase [Anaerolineae bacterium]|nr:purine-nucleoside phosphorylase [Anaerolineae bacterium]